MINGNKCNIIIHCPLLKNKVKYWYEQIIIFRDKITPAYPGTGRKGGRKR